MKEFDTDYGVFREGDRIIVHKTEYYGNTKAPIEGTIVGMRENMGTKFLILEDFDGVPYEVALRSGCVDSITVVGKSHMNITSSNPVEIKPKATQYSRVIR